MKVRLVSAVALAAILAGGTAFAAETAAAPAAAPTPAAAAAPSTAAAVPAAKPAAKPAVRHRVSACTAAIAKSEKALKVSKTSPEGIAQAWQHVGAAKQARKDHKAKTCLAEADAAIKLLK